MTKVYRALVRMLAATAVLSASHARGGEPTLPEFFQAPTLIDSYSLPVDMTFAPSGDYMVAEKAGLVFFHVGEVKQVTPFIDLRDEVNLNGDRGLLAVALHPGWVPDGGATSWVYLLYTVTPVFGQNWGYDQDGQYPFSRLTRYRADTVSGDVVATLASREVLLGNQDPDGTVDDGIASLHVSHSNGTLAFADDGSLLVSLGDGAHFDFTDTGGFDPEGFEDYVHPTTGLQGPMRQVQDSGAFRAQDLRSLSGKIIRINPETGFGYPSNPFFDGNVRSNPSKVWALGLRNPFKFSLKRGTGASDPALGQPNTIYVGDVGWQTWEEFNVVKGAENFGWPCFEGPDPQADYQAYDSGTSQYNYPDCLTANPGTPTLPILSWSRTDPAQVTPFGFHFDAAGQPAGGFIGSCALGGVQYHNGSYPSFYWGKFFVADYTAGWVKVLEMDPADNLIGIHDFGENFPRLIDIDRHPVSGDLYMVLLEDQVGRVRHLRYSTDASPTALASATPLFGDAPLVVDFDGTSSSDPELQPLDYEWDFGDGSPLSSSATPQHTFTSNGIFEVTLKVTDAAAQSDSTKVVVAVGNTPPTATITSIESGSLFTIPSTIPLEGTGSDTQDTNLSYDWEIDLFHETHVHPSIFQSPSQTDAFLIETHGKPGDLDFYRVRLTVTDSGGLSDTAEAFLYLESNYVDITGTAQLISRVDELLPPESLPPGNTDIEVLRDGIRPAQVSLSTANFYPTRHLSDKFDDDWVGLVLPQAPDPAARFVALEFQEGQHSFNGGWWDSLDVEVRDAGVWSPVSNLLISPDYPFEFSDQSQFDGINYDTYQMRFDPTHGDAIRLRGIPGGILDYVTIAELRAYMVRQQPPVELVDYTPDGTVIAKLDELIPPNPLGNGNTSTGTIRNGTLPEVGTVSYWGQYDTNHGGDQGTEDWIGYSFSERLRFTRVEYQEGMHTTEGGRLLNLRIEVQKEPGDPWLPVQNLTSQPLYPGDANLAATYERFTFDFDPIRGSAIRIIGDVDGTIGWIGVGELRVLGQPRSIYDVSATRVEDAAGHHGSSRPPSVHFTTAAQSAVENEGQVVATVQLSWLADTDVTVPLTLTGTADAGVDYDINPLSVLIPQGQMSANLLVDLTPDPLDENAETIVISLGSPSGAALGANFVHTVTILDDDPLPIVNFTQATQDVGEGAGSTSIEVQLNTASGRDVVLPYTVAGTATVGADFSLRAAQFLIPEGQQSATLALNVVDDALGEVDETVELELTPPAAATLGAVFSQVVTIQDDDEEPELSFTSASQTVGEEAGTTTITLELSAAASQVVTVSYTLSGTAVAPDDYGITPNLVILQPGVTSIDLDVVLVDDALVEAHETISVTLGTPTNAQLGATSVHTVTITDNDDPEVFFSAASQSVDEAAGTIMVTLELSAPANEIVTVPYSVSGTATLPDDYAISPNLALLPAGTTTFDLLVTIEDDSLVEGDEDLIISIGAPTNATVGTPAAHTLTIQDND